MLKEYSISNILSTTEYTPYYIGTFEDTNDPDIEWAHRHSFYSFVWFTEGSGFYVVDFQEYEIKPQRLFIVNTKQIHNWDYSSNSKGYILMLDVPIGAEIGINIVSPYIEVPELYIPILESCFINLTNEFSINDRLSDISIKAGAKYLLSVLNRISSQESTPKIQSNSLMDRFKQLILTESLSTQTIEKYADKLHSSENELNQICKEHTGLSVKQYLLDLKITEAKRLLLFEDLNVNEIAYQLGFEDSSYFARIFKKKTQLTPSDFLKKYRKDK